MADPDYAGIVARVLTVERSEAERQAEDCDSEPGPPASEAAIAAAEAARGRTFPEPYRAFLRVCDGWAHFSWGVSLFSTAELAGAAYEDGEERFEYSDDVPDELAQALIIGVNENDAGMVLLLDSGEVVDFLYAEEERFPDLATFLLDREATLIEMRGDALEQISAIEAEWDPAFRARVADEITATLKAALAAPPEAPRSSPEAFVDPDAAPTPAATALVQRAAEGRLDASVGLGLVLYLYAPPTRDECVATFRAFRDAFPFDGPFEWTLADAVSFGMTPEPDPAAEPFADALRVDDQGFYGVRVDAGGRLLNVRGIPPRDDAEADEPARRASFVEVLVPADADPARLRALAEALAERLPIVSGHGGYFARVHRTAYREEDPWNTVFAWCRRYFTVEPEYVDGWLEGALQRVRGAGWLTVLGRPVLDALGDLELPQVTRYDGAHAAVLTAGALTLGDVQRGEFPADIAAVARAIAPITLGGWSRHGTISMGGVWFSTHAEELPGFGVHAATGAFLRRLVDPAAFLAPTVRERGLAMIQRLRDSMDDAQRAEWRKTSNLDDLYYLRDLLRALYNGSYFSPDPALQIEALELAAEVPDVTPPQTYNNLLFRYLAQGAIDAGMAVMPRALETAARNSHTYHNAACILVAAGALDQAMAVVEQAMASDYPHKDRIATDDDLAPLRDRPAWKALFG